MNNATAQSEALSIPAPRFETLCFHLKGTTPYMQARFSEKARNMMREKMESGSVSQKGKKRDARNFNSDYQQALHRAKDGWCGIPAGAFRAACISACRLVGFTMTMAKLSLFVEADGYDALDGTPLIRIFGKPEKSEMLVRTQPASPTFARGRCGANGRAIFACVMTAINSPDSMLRIFCCGSERKWALVKDGRTRKRATD